jgi:hypothetical protein
MKISVNIPFLKKKVLGQKLKFLAHSGRRNMVKINFCVIPFKTEKNYVPIQVSFSTQFCSLQPLFWGNEQNWVLNGTLISS